jgi:sulfate adenylyltransferase
VVAFQTRNPLHRVHEELLKRATQRADGVLLLHPVVGLTKPGDVDHYTRVRTYKALVQGADDAGRLLLSLLPLAMRMAGPREALWHALIRRNYGANYLIVGRDHASPGLDSHGKPFYGPYDAQALVEQYSAELGVGVIPFEELVYLPDEDRYEEVSRVSSRARTASISGTQVRQEYLTRAVSYLIGLPVGSRRDSRRSLSTAPPTGVCVWFTGLSGQANRQRPRSSPSSSSSVDDKRRCSTAMSWTHLSRIRLQQRGSRHRIRRIGFVAAEIVRHGGVTICAAVSPYLMTRNEVRDMVGQDRFIEVFVDTPLQVCEERDAKGMYAKARRGEITGFTGIDDPL